jgi:ankyrin repeat protein
MLVIEYHQDFVHYGTTHYSFNTFMQTTTLASLAYYNPWITTNPTFKTSHHKMPHPTISLSFPCMRPPDSDIFVFIRHGKIEDIKSLLLEGRASVLDVAAPYGLSTMSLAISYGRMDIYHLLLSAGANSYNPISAITKGIHVFEFFNAFYSQNYNMSTAEIIQDNIHQTAPQTEAKIFGGTRSCAGVTYDLLTRLHKCILGLASECLPVILPAVSCIDDVDYLGRTALHLATYKSDAQAITLLLKWGAKPDLMDHTGKTPLHISAAFGSAPCTKVLAPCGTNPSTRSTRRFSSTLHLQAWASTGDRNSPGAWS